MWGPQETQERRAASLGLAAASRVVLSLDEVRKSGLPALFLDFGEALLYADGELFDVRGQGPEKPARVPLPGEILRDGVGIDYGWRHAGGCDCLFCLRRAPSGVARDSAA